MRTLGGRAQCGFYGVDSGRSIITAAGPRTTLRKDRRFPAWPAVVAAVAVLLHVSPSAARVLDELEVIAQTGDTDLNGRSLIEVDPHPSINDDGTVAFVGRFNRTDGRLAENVYVSDADTRSLRPLLNASQDVFEWPQMSASPPQQTFSPPQINNANVVLAQRRTDAQTAITSLFCFPFCIQQLAPAPFTYLEKWDAGVTGLPLELVAQGNAGLGPVLQSPVIIFFFERPFAGNCTLATGSLFCDLFFCRQLFGDCGLPSALLANTPWLGIHSARNASFPSLNNNGRSSFAGLASGNFLATPGFSPTDFNQLQLPGEPLRSRIADDGSVLVRQESGAVQLLNYDLSQKALLSSNGGKNPGISDDGNVVAFAADAGNGKAVYITYAMGGSFSTPMLVAGGNQGGVCAGPELGVDDADNPLCFIDVDLDAALGVMHTQSGPPDVGDSITVTFIATPNGAGSKSGFSSARGLWTVRVNLESTMSGGVEPVVIGAAPVAQLDDTLPGGAVIGDIVLHDPVNNNGDIVFAATHAGGSAIVLAETPSMLEFIDPNDPNNPSLLTNGSVSTDPDLLANAKIRRRGAAADGTTRIVLRANLPESGIMEFSLDGSSSIADDGGLTTIGGGQPALSVRVFSVTTTGGEKAFALYQTPLEFNPRSMGGQEGAMVREVQFTGRFTPSQGAAVDVMRPFRLVRPPMVLIHGLWSSAAAWSGFFPLITDQRFLVVEPADYMATNADHFVTNAFVPAQAAQRAIEKIRRRRLAGTKVDVVGHSMGGILSRNHVALGNYRNATNFDEGDLHKLITLDTPHTGSPFANLLVAVRGTFGQLAERGFAAINMPIHLGAIEDLAVGSSEINKIQMTEVPGHAVVGIGGSDALELAPGKIGTLYQIVNLLAPVSDLFQGLQHDFIVGRNSQEGGLPASAQFIIGGLDGIHISFNVLGIRGGVTNSQAVSEHVIDLLNMPATDSAFAFFPAPSGPFPLQFQSQGLLSGLGQSVVSVSVSGLNIVSPAAGTSVPPGQAIVVTVEPDAGITVTTVLLVTDGAWALDDSPPFELALTIPIEAAGPITLMALGTDGQGNFFGSDEVTLFASPQATLTGLTIIPREAILFSLGETQQLHVVGTFDDGVVRDLTSAATGTTYVSLTPDVVSVSADGLMEAEGPGRTTVVVQNGALEARIQVESGGKVAGCGNGIVELGEGCDDGGVADGDCCSPTCQSEPNGSPCTDTSDCTQLDECDGAGRCIGGSPVICTALDQCHAVGVCDPTTGQCSNPPASAGIPCDDGNACTQTDGCNGAGLCIGGSPVICTALGGCHAVGTCDPATGQCSSPPSPAGTLCDDTNGCTRTDRCDGAGGECVGADPMVCTVLDECHVLGTCHAATGQCSNPFAPGGTPCTDSDGIQCTIAGCDDSGMCDQGHINQCSTPVPTDTPPPTNTPTQCRSGGDPDVNRDGRVTVLDLAIVGKCHGRDPSTAACCKSDLDGDGDVDRVDLELVRRAIRR